MTYVFCTVFIVDVSSRHLRRNCVRLGPRSRRSLLVFVSMLVFVMMFLMMPWPPFHWNAIWITAGTCQIVNFQIGILDRFFASAFVSLRDEVTHAGVARVTALSLWLRLLLALMVFCGLIDKLMGFGCVVVMMMARLWLLRCTLVAREHCVGAVMGWSD